MIDLFPYQKEGVEFLSNRRRALLLDAPGLGKTAQALVAADNLGAEAIDVVCPASVVTQWQHNHDDLSTRKKVKYHGWSYDRVRKHGLPATDKKPRALILDEVHYLKNGHSARTKRVFGSMPYGKDGEIFKAEYVWGLTGTPSPKDPSDLFPAMNAVIPGSLRLPNGQTMDYWQFIKRFCVTYDSGYGLVVLKGKNLEELAERLAPYVLRRTKEEVLREWKEPKCAELWLDAGEAKSLMFKAENEPEAKAVAEAFAQGSFEALMVLARTAETGISRYRRYVGMLKIAPVVKWLLDQFDCGMDKVVLICVHREVMDGIASGLTKHEIKHQMYRGGMTDTQKDNAKKEFVADPECRVFIGQLFASGTGLDGLQHATGDMLFVEWSWVADDNHQALCRLDRIGQKNPVIGRFAGLEGSLDGAIMSKAARRAAENKTLFG